MCMCCAVLSCFSRIWLFAILWNVAHQVPLSMGFSRQEYWSGFPCPPPGHLPNPGIEPMTQHLLHWQEGSLPLVPSGNPGSYVCIMCNNEWISHCAFVHSLNKYLLNANCVQGIMLGPCIAIIKKRVRYNFLGKTSQLSFLGFLLTTETAPWLLIYFAKGS